MKFSIITIFPQIFNSYLNESILKRAQQKGLIKIRICNLRDFVSGKHKKVDDVVYGGGPGMVFKAEPIARAIFSVLKSKINPPSGGQKLKTKIIIFSPAGRQFDNKMAADLAKKYDRLILVCGRYEGIDERVRRIIENWQLSARGGSALGGKIENLSIGPYVLTGGELPAMVLIDAVSRHIPGVLGKEESIEEKREGIGVPVFTRPAEIAFRGKKYRVPKVLLSGNHKKIQEWRESHRKI